MVALDDFAALVTRMGDIVAAGVLNGLVEGNPAAL